MVLPLYMTCTRSSHQCSHRPGKALPTASPPGSRLRPYEIGYRRCTAWQEEWIKTQAIEERCSPAAAPKMPPVTSTWALFQHAERLSRSKTEILRMEWKMSSRWRHGGIRSELLKGLKALVLPPIRALSQCGSPDGVLVPPGAVEEQPPLGQGPYTCGEK